MADEVKTDISEEKPSEPKKQNFFKSTSFKCIVVLLAIVLVCGILLTICNSLFYVSDEERLSRAISKIYGETVEYNELEVDDSIYIGGNSTVNAVYEITSEGKEGDYLLNAVGKGGFDGGTVTCYILLNVTDGELTVKTVTISSNTSQSYISNIKTSMLESFAAVFGADTSSTSEYYVLYNSEDGFYTDDPNSVTNHLKTGATYSMGAICNAVNGAVSYIKAVVLGEVEENPYADYVNYDKINIESSAWTTSDGVTTYNLVTTSNGMAGSFEITITVDASKTVKSFEVVTNGSTSGFDSDMMDTSNLVGKSQTELEAMLDGTGDSISTGATLSNTLCVNAALFAVSNYDFCSATDKTAETEDGDEGGDGNEGDDGGDGGETEDPDIYEGFAYTDYIDSSATTYSVSGTEVTYSITTTSNSPANAFVITVTVDSDKTVKSFEIVTNGGTADYFVTNTIDTNIIVGKSQTELDALLTTTSADSETIATGATYSNTLCVYAALFAVANYDLCYETYFNETYEYTGYISSATTYSVSGTEVTYSITTTSNGAASAFTITVTVDSDKTVKSFEIMTNGSTYGFESSMMDTSILVGKSLTELEALLSTTSADSETIATGATKSNTLCVYAALFAVANYDLCIETYFNETYTYTEYISSATTYSVSGDVVIYSITTTGYSAANAFTITVTVDSNKTVKSFEIVTNGSTYNFDSSMMDTSILVGKDEDSLNTLLASTSSDSETIITGATKSNTLCVYAALFAVANYDLCVGGAE